MFCKETRVLARDVTLQPVTLAVGVCYITFVFVSFIINSAACLQGGSLEAHRHSDSWLDVRKNDTGTGSGAIWPEFSSSPLIISLTGNWAGTERGGRDKRVFWQIRVN